MKNYKIDYKIWLDNIGRTLSLGIPALALCLVSIYCAFGTAIGLAQGKFLEGGVNFLITLFCVLATCYLGDAINKLNKKVVVEKNG